VLQFTSWQLDDTTKRCLHPYASSYNFHAYHRLHRRARLAESCRNSRILWYCRYKFTPVGALDGGNSWSRVSCLFDRPVALGGAWQRNFKFWRARARDSNAGPRPGEKKAGAGKSIQRPRLTGSGWRNYASPGAPRRRPTATNGSVPFLFVLFYVCWRSRSEASSPEADSRSRSGETGHRRAMWNCSAGPAALAPRFVELCSYYCLVVCPPGTRQNDSRCDR
jgi:hypothetical protein